MLSEVPIIAFRIGNNQNARSTVFLLRSSLSGSITFSAWTLSPAPKNLGFDVACSCLASTSRPAEIQPCRRTFSSVQVCQHIRKEVRSSDPMVGAVSDAAIVMTGISEYSPNRIVCLFSWFTSASYNILPDCGVRSSLQGESLLFHLQNGVVPYICICRATIRRQWREPCHRLSPDVRNDPRVWRFRPRHRESPPPLGEICYASDSLFLDEKENSCHCDKCNTDAVEELCSWAAGRWK